MLSEARSAYLGAMRILFTALLFLASTAASAQFIALLKNSPAELFDEDDLKIFWATANRTLDQGVVNEPIAWDNPKTKHRGDMTVLSQFESNGRDCKRVRVRNEAQGRKSDMRHNLCKVDGRWRLVGDIKPGDKK